MATRPNVPSREQARAFGQLIESLAPQVRRGFMASVTDLQSNVDWTRLLAELEVGNIDGAILALNIAPAAWAEYSAAVSDAYAQAGASTVAQIRRSGLGGVGTRFNMQNPRAQQWISENVGNKIAGFAREQIETAREIIGLGYGAGEHPHAIARTLAGRVGPRGVREGGILGLDGPRAMRYYKVKTGMRTAEGVRALVIEHRDGALSLRYKVNQSTAKKILSAYRNGSGVPEAARLIGERQYYNALLRDRADAIAETETGNAVMSARDNEWHELAEAEGISQNNVIKTWRHRRGASQHHRPDHLAMSGQSVRGLNTPFIFPDGVSMQHAHDPEGGAAHTIRCGCDTEYRVDHTMELS